VVVAALAVALPGLAGAAPDAPKGIPLLSDWLGPRDGWAWIADAGQVRATADGGRTWETIFGGGTFLSHPFARTSRSAGLVSTGGRAGSTTHWTNDGGRDWFLLDEIPMGAVAAGTGNQLYWHDGWDTLFRVEGWPPRGDFACVEMPSELGPPLPGHRLCRAVDDGLRSVVAMRLPGGRFGPYGGMALVPPAQGQPGGIVELVSDLPHPRGGAPGRGVVVVRGGGLALSRLLPYPALRSGEETDLETILASWPRLYVLAPLSKASPDPAVGRSTIGAVLLRSRDGGDGWASHLARSLPRRVAHVRGPARLDARVPLPGGWVAAGRAGGRPVVTIRQLDRTRPLLALPGSARCAALRPVVDWPHVVVEGTRGTQLRAVWLSSDGGYRWTAFGRC
jgi:hypothetical protein